MYSVNVIVDTSEGTQDHDLQLPAVPQVGDAIAFERDDGEDVYVVDEVTFRVHADGTVRVYLTASCAV